MLNAQKKTVVCLFLCLSSVLSAQDTSKIITHTPLLRHELGLSILTPIILLAGASDHSERFSNLTYRYRVAGKQAVRLLFGTGVLATTSQYSYQPVIINNNQLLYYSATKKSTVQDLQVGMGYEYMIGRRKIKHVFGVDIVFNNVIKKSESFYVQAAVSNQATGYHFKKIDSIGTRVSTQQINKIGLNLNYSLRYELSKRWCVTGSIIAAYRFSNNYKGSKDYSTMDFDIKGVISDISLFYRF